MHLVRHANAHAGLWLSRFRGYIHAKTANGMKPSQSVWSNSLWTLQLSMITCRIIWHHHLHPRHAGAKPAPLRVSPGGGSGPIRSRWERRRAAGSRAVRLQGVLEQTAGDPGVFHRRRLVQNRSNQTTNKPSCPSLRLLSDPSHQPRRLRRPLTHATSPKSLRL